MGEWLRSTSGRTAARSLASLFLLAPVAATAQEYGQWWWDGRVAYGQRANQTDVEGTLVRDYDEQELRLELGLNGYLGHPVIGRFRLGLEGSSLDLGGQRELKSDRLGYSAELDLLPRSGTPLHLAYRKGTFDYTPRPSDPAFFLTGAADQSETFSGRLRIRRGPLAGTALGADLVRTSLVDEAMDDDESDRYYLRWSRRLGAFDNNLTLDQNERRYGRLGFETGVRSASFDQRARLAERWRWQLGLIALRTESRYLESDDERLSIDDLRGRASLARELRGTDLLDFDFDAARAEPSGGETGSVYRVALTYRWRPRPGSEIAPFVEAGEGETGQRRETYSRGGLAFSWGHAGRIDFLASARTSYGTTRREGTLRPGESDLAYSGSLSLGGGDARRLRTEVELEGGHNELRFDRIDGELDAPDLGLLAATVGRQDLARGRLKVSHQGIRARLSGWIEQRFLHLESLNDRSIDSSALTGTVEAGWHGISLLANIGEVTVEETGLEDRVVDFWGGNLNWRLLRGLSLFAIYRHDVRSLAPLPDLEADRGEAGLTFHLGLLRISASYYDHQEMLAVETQRTDRGFHFLVSRDFAGWLPIVTGSRRRGEVR